MIAAPADPVASVRIVEGVAAVGGGQAEVPTCLHRGHVLGAGKATGS